MTFPAIPGRTVFMKILSWCGRVSGVLTCIHADSYSKWIHTHERPTPCARIHTHERIGFEDSTQLKCIHPQPSPARLPLDAVGLVQSARVVSR